MKKNRTIILYFKILWLLGLLNSLSCCTRVHQYQIISHNALCGKTDLMHFTSVDTGYIITHIGDLYDSVHSTYVYQTINGGTCWQIVDSIPNFSFSKYSHTIYKNIVYGYMSNGTQSMDGYWNSYVCMIDLENHRHKVRDEAFYGPGDVFYYNGFIFFPASEEKTRYIFRFDGDLNNIFYENDPFPENIKDISYNDSVLAFITYDKKVCYLQDCQMSENHIDLSCNGILLSGDDCYISYFGDREHNGGIILHNCLTDCYKTLDFPSGYRVVELLKATSDSIIITVTQKNSRGFNDNIVYSTDKGLTWKKITLQDPIIFPEYNSCFYTPYLYIKSSFSNEIYKLNIK